MTAPEIRTAPATEHPCEVRQYHSPEPLVTQHHHGRPEYLQMRLWNEVRHGPDTWVCGTDHDSIHAVVYWLMGERRRPSGAIGRLVMDRAQAIVDWYGDELHRKVAG